MEPQKLACAVVHWLEFESLCGRDRLFTEAALKTPVHHFLTANEPYDVFLEHPYPHMPTAMAGNTGRKKSLDFCLRRPGGGKAFVNVIESKFVNDRRAFAQEVLDDLYRLRWMKLFKQTQPCDRWLLIAGQWKDIKEQVLNKGSTKKKQILDRGLYGVLHRTLNQLHTVDVKNSSKKQRKRWSKAADQLMQTNLPSEFKSKLEAFVPSQPNADTQYVCMIWRVIKPVSKRK